MPRKTFTAGSELLDSELNTYFMDQVVMTYASATARNTAIPSPTEGMLTYLNDTNLYQTYTGSEWVNVLGYMPRVELTKTTDQSVANATYVTATGWTQTEIRGGFTEASGVVTVPLTGRYIVTASTSWNTNAAGSRVMGISINGASSPSIPGSSMTPAGVFTHQTVTHILKLNANDTLQIKVYQSSGGALTLNGAGFGGSGLKFVVEYLGY